LDELLTRAADKAPAGIEDTGPLAANLAADASRMMTGSTLRVDGGYHSAD